MEQISSEEAREVLESAPVAHLGMILDGAPYVTPMSYVLDGDTILFRTMPGQKLTALRTSPRVCMEVSIYDDDSGDWVSVIVTGDAREVSDDALKNTAISHLFRKYEKVMGSPLSRSPGPQPIGGLPTVVAVSIDEMSGMSSGRGWTRRTRPGRL